MITKPQIEVILPRSLFMLRRNSSAEIDVDKFSKELESLSSREEESLISGQESLKSVSFCEETTVLATLNRAEYTPEERKNCWYTREDVHRSKKMSQPTIALMKAGLLSRNTERHCTRGLEHRIYGRAMERRRIRKAAQDAVLDEQGRSNNPDDISNCYKEASVACGFRAHSVGVDDEIEATVVYNEVIKKTEPETQSDIPPKVPSSSLQNLLSYGLCTLQ
mmetsp:Transcript_6220/g.9564  ORF Transcript_6220/g.9564 Transcript_6220/m.9564 type:complete len:221 (+) Transcript_6220:53-715(+)